MQLMARHALSLALGLLLVAMGTACSMAQVKLSKTQCTSFVKGATFDKLIDETFQEDRRDKMRKYFEGISTKTRLDAWCTGDLDKGMPESESKYCVCMKRYF